MSEPLLCLRDDSGHVTAAPIIDVGATGLRRAAPWRSFRWAHKQLHRPGTYWSATMSAQVGHESQLELWRLLLLDFDPEVVRITSQPFLINGDDRGGTRRHIPDYLVEYAGGRLAVVDVKPKARLGAPRVRESLDWSRRVIEDRGWEFRIETEPDPVVALNVKFLSGYRRAIQFDAAEVERVASRIQGEMTFSNAVEEAARAVTDERRARSLVLRLLWLHRLTFDPTTRLNGATILAPA